MSILSEVLLALSGFTGGLIEIAKARGFIFEASYQFISI